MFRLIGIYIRRTLLSPLTKREMRCFLICLLLGLGIMLYGIIRANGYFGLPQAENYESYFKSSHDFMLLSVLIALVLKGIRTDREMSAEIVFCPHVEAESKTSNNASQPTN